MRMAPNVSWRSNRALPVVAVLVLIPAFGATQDRPASPSPSPPLDDALKKIGTQLLENAAAGDMVAQRIVGTLLVAASSYEDAAFWLTKAADQGDAFAQGTLGWLYRTGEGVAQDFSKAFQLSMAAAEQGDPQGALTLAVLHSVGLGRPVNNRDAVKWARFAAEQDCRAKKRPIELCAQAQGLMGAAHLTGEGVPQDFVLAHMWANLAAAALPPGEARERALGVRDAAARKMNREQIAEAQRLARDWKPFGSR